MIAFVLRVIGIACALFVAAAAVPALAASQSESLQGLVLATLSMGQVVVRHDPGCGMPAMTMRFQVQPYADAAQLRAGDRIYARVDLKADPAAISHVQVIGYQAGPTGDAVHNVTPFAVGDAMPDTTFFDQSGRGFSFDDFRGETVVMAFIYTRCRDPRMCPLISSNFHVLQRELAGLPVHLVEITLDPAHDTPAVLTRYGRQFGQNPSMWTLGTGPVDVVNDFAAQFGIAVFADPSLGLIHSDRTAIINRDGMITDLLDAAAWNPNDVAARVRALSAVPTNPIAYLDFELSKAAAAICGNSLPGYSGLLDLVVMLGIFGAVSWVLYYVARKIFIEEV